MLKSTATASSFLTILIVGSNEVIFVAYREKLHKSKTFEIKPPQIRSLKLKECPFHSKDIDDVDWDWVDFYWQENYIL